jgi:hypothetical protein
VGRIVRKKVSMRHKTAGEVIRDLETRIAQLETRKGSRGVKVELRRNPEEAERAWPKVTYQRLSVPRMVKALQKECFEHLWHNHELLDSYGERVELVDYQEVYLGYNPKTDEFCMGFDLGGRVSDYSENEYWDRMDDYEDDPDFGEPEEPEVGLLSGYVIFKYDARRKRIEFTDVDGIENHFYPNLYRHLPKGFVDVRLD